MSLYGTIAILAVLLFRLIFQKCPKKVLILFWIAVAVRLCVPINFNSPTSALNLGMAFSQKSSAEQTVSYDPEARLREITSPERPVKEETGADDPAGVPAETTSGISFRNVIPIVWISVAAAMMIFSAVRYAVFYSRARWSSRSFDGRYYMANDIDSPFVVGIIKPKIFFPLEIDDDEREYVLNHEWIHIKYKDGLTKLLAYIVLCIHWFNPLVWLFFYMLCADIEMRVDEDTTGNFNLSMVKEYCKSLVKHASGDKGGTFMQSTAFSGLGFGGMETKIRIKNLLDRKIDSKGIQIGAIILTLPVVILISASSIDHKPPVMPPPSETAVTSASPAPSYTETTASSETSETTETTETTVTSETPASSDPSHGSFSDLPDGTAMSFDVDLDNNCDVVKGVFGKVEIRMFGMADTVFTINGREFVIEDLPHGKYLVPHLMKTGGQTFIYLSMMDDNNENWALYIFSIGDERLSLAWKLENTYYSEVESCDQFWLTESGGKDNMFSVTRACYLESNGYPRHKDNMCYQASSTQYAASYDLEGVIVRDGQVTNEKVKIAQGDTVTIEKIDEMNYLDAKREDGTSVRIDFTFAYNDHYYRGSDRWVFDALDCMFEPAS